MTRLVHCTVLALGALLVACDPGSYSDLSRPTIAVITTEAGGFCSAVYAVDADRAVWAAGGCGDSTGALRRRDVTVSAEERAMLDEAMTVVLALPDDTECDLPTTSGRRFRFVRTRPGGGEDEVRQCEPGVPLDAVRLADRLEVLATGGGADAGAADGGATDAGTTDAGP
ncbi:MAG: hypothetical protein KC619_05240 [Myxococcales bacterium]|nr:hypothetical protein [Myxococcales bacterium]